MWSKLFSKESRIKIYSGRTTVYFEEPGLQKSYEKFAESMKNAPVEEKKKLVKELFVD